MSASRVILLVDDDRDLLTALSGGLRQRGYEVAVAPDAVAAMSAAVRLKPSVVVLDVGLPGGEGTVVMKRMHALPQLAGVPVIMMSGRDPRQYREDALAAGASAYLSKPIDVDDLVVAIRIALGEDIGLDAAAMKGGEAGGRLVDILKDMGLVTDEQIASALARQSEVAAASAAFADKVVMLVDDDEDLLVALAAPLRRQGFDVTVATDAVTAISTAVKQPPDVVIMDIGLPGRRWRHGDAAAALAAAAGRRARDHAQRARRRQAPGRSARRRGGRLPRQADRAGGAHRRRRQGAGRRHRFILNGAAAPGRA